MKFVQTIAWATVVAVSVIGCASVDVHQVKNHTDKTHGVRFFASKPYLLVAETQPATGTARKLEYSVIWLPNPNEEYEVEARGGWGTVDSSVSLKDGWELQSVGTKLDSKGPETISAVASLATAAFTALENVSPFHPGLYEIVFGRDGVVTGFKLAAELPTFASK